MGLNETGLHYFYQHDIPLGFCQNNIVRHILNVFLLPYLYFQNHFRLNSTSPAFGKVATILSISPFGFVGKLNVTPSKKSHPSKKS